MTSVARHGDLSRVRQLAVVNRHYGGAAEHVLEHKRRTSARMGSGVADERSDLDDLIQDLESVVSRARLMLDWDRTRTSEERTAGRIVSLTDYFDAKRTPVVGTRAPEEAGEDVARVFRELADRWREETEFVASPRAAYAHEAYLQIIGLGPTAIPLLLRDLEEGIDDWFWALACITRENPAAGMTDFEHARHAWLDWGRTHRNV